MTVEVFGNLDLKGNRIVGGAAGVADTDLATVGQVLQLRNQTDQKDAVRVATTGSNIALTGLQTIDGIALAAGDRVLVKDQTDAKTNGIYVVATGAWARATDADASTEVTFGLSVAVVSGTTKGTGFTIAAAVNWILATPDVITIGTTPLSFQVQGGTGSAYGPGDGIAISGSMLATKQATDGGLTADSNGLALLPGYKNNPQGTWSNLTSYKAGDIVQRSVHQYKALSNHSGADPLTDTSKWVRIYDGLLERVTDPLALWKRAMAEGNATWLAIGGGFTEGELANARANRWLDKTATNLRNALSVKYGNRFVPPVYAVTPSWSVTATSSSGTITDSTAAVVPGMRGKQFANGAQAIYTLVGTSVDIWFATGPAQGTFVYNIDDTVNISVNAYAVANGTARVRVSLGVRSTHTLKLVATTGTFVFGGLTQFDGDESSGIRVYDGARTLATFTSLPANASYLTALAPDLVTIDLGAEIGIEQTQTQTRDALIAYIAGIRSVLTDKLPSVMIVLPETASFGTAGAIYKAAVAEVLNLDRTVGVIDLTKLGYDRKPGLPRADRKMYRTNIVSNPVFATQNWDYVLPGATSTWAQATTGGLNYLGATTWLRVQATAAPSQSTPAYIYPAAIGTGGLPVTAGTAYTFSGYGIASKNPTGGMQAGVDWYNSAGAIVGTQALGAASALTAGVWGRRSVTATAPAGAAYARPFLAFVTVTNFISGDYYGATGFLGEEGSTLSRFYFGTELLGIRRNLANNPRAVNGQTQWTYTAGTGEAGATTYPTTAIDAPSSLPGYMRRGITTAKTGGSNVLTYIEATDGGLAGDVRTVSAWVRSSVTSSVTLGGGWRSGGTTTAAGNTATQPLVAGVWTRVSLTLTAAPSVYDSTVVTVSQPPAVVLPVGANLDITQILIEDTSSVLDYFDGSLAKDAGYLYGWVGTASASSSTSTPRGFYPTDDGHTVVAKSVTTRLLALPVGSSSGGDSYQRYQYLTTQF